jgi:hypothetical protein
MENGDRITGEIKGLDAGVSRVELEYVDVTIPLQWLKVARVESSRIFLVRTQDGDFPSRRSQTDLRSPFRRKKDASKRLDRGAL